MNTLTIAVFACLAICASAVPSGIWGGVWGHHDDGQWHGEGLLESQDWAGHAGHGVGIVAPGAALIAPHAAAVVGHGLGLGLGHGHGGAVVAGPAGAILANVHHGGIALGHGHHW